MKAFKSLPKETSTRAIRCQIAARDTAHVRAVREATDVSKMEAVAKEGKKIHVCIKARVN